MSTFRFVKRMYPPFFQLRKNHELSKIFGIQQISFGSKKQKEKVDKEKKKLRKLLKISNIELEEEGEKGGGMVKDTGSAFRADPKERRIGEKNEVDYKTYDIKMKEIITSFEEKIRKILDNSINVETFNNISVMKEKKNYKFSDIAQVVIKSSNSIFIYPYMNSDIPKIIHSLKLKDNMWNPQVSDNSEYVHLLLPSVTEEMKKKKKKEAKDLLEKVKNDVRNVRHKIREDAIKKIEGDEWKIVERNKLDSYIKEKIKNIETIYETALKKY